jgi:hypothetical protein
MATFPYTSNAGRLKEFLQEIQSVGVPPKVTVKYLESLGYNSKNDRNFIGILKAVAFLDANGVPTETWKRFRNTSQASAVMAAALRKAYSGLFQQFPDAYRRDNEALRNYFSSHTDVGDGALKFMASTFKSMCELGNFDDSVSENESDHQVEASRGNATEKSSAMQVSQITRNTAAGVTININVQLQIPDTDNADTYDRFFAAMQKHLLS